MAWKGFQEMQENIIENSKKGIHIKKKFKNDITKIERRKQDIGMIHLPGEHTPLFSLLQTH